MRPQHFAMGEWSIARAATCSAGVITADPRPTAVICGNAHLTVGALLEAPAMGLKVPEEVSIVGYDDIEIMSHLPVPAHYGARSGAGDRPQRGTGPGRAPEGRDLDIPLESEAEIVVRASSGPPPAYISSLPKDPS